MGATAAVRILVTGIRGYVGSRLAQRLQRAGHEVVGFSRAPDGQAHGVPVLQGDAVSGAGLAPALDGIEIAYFLIHSMEPSVDGSFAEREQAAAENFTRAAQTAGVARVIYLGGLVPATGVPSAHLASRLGVEEILLAASPCSVAFRASIVIGAGSRSFRFLVRLVERLPVLALPAWQTHRTSPIDERDVIEALVRAASDESVCGRSLDLAGPDIVSYGELVQRIRDQMLLGRPTISFKRLTLTPIASRISALIAEEEHALIGPLMEGLEADLLARDDLAAKLLKIRLHSLDRAIEHALGEWEAIEPLAAR